MAASLQAAFSALCRDFFPRWRARSSWTVVESPHGQWVDAQGVTHTTRESGYCDHTTRTIFIHRWRNTLECRGTMIHEICHAVTTGAHDKRFCARLRLAAQHARARGDEPLSAQLRAEADAYESGPVDRASPYDRIRDILCANPGATFEHVLTSLAYYCAETAPALLEQYPRLHAVYQRTRRQEITALRAQCTAARAAGVPEGMLTYIEERLGLLEAVTDTPPAPPKHPGPRKTARVG